MTTNTAKSEPITYEVKNLPRFPITLFHFNKYDGGKALVAGFFLMASIYFFTGFFGFLIDHNAWLKDLIYGPPTYDYVPTHWWQVWKHFGNMFGKVNNIINSTLSYVDLFLRGLIFVASYCLAWATFDPKNIEGYVMGIFNAALGVAYLLLPTDIVPDMVPLVGNLDDAFLGSSMIILGVSSFYRTQMRERKTETVLELVNHGKHKRALQLLLEDKGITINAITNSEK